MGISVEADKRRSVSSRIYICSVCCLHAILCCHKSDCHRKQQSRQPKSCFCVMALATTPCTLMRSDFFREVRFSTIVQFSRKAHCGAKFLPNPFAGRDRSVYFSFVSF